MPRRKQPPIPKLLLPAPPKKPSKKKPEFTPEELLEKDLRASGYFVTKQHQFHESDVGDVDRKWTFDFAWPEQKLAVEVQGLGRHNRAAGIRDDYQKFNCATELGWRMLLYPAGIIRVNKRRARVVEQIQRLLCGVADPDVAAVVLSGE